MGSSTAYRIWLPSWLGLLLLGVLNGTVRGTVLRFERLVGKLAWSELLADYDGRAGRIWVLVPVWTAVAPEVMRRLTLPQAPRRPEAR